MIVMKAILEKIQEKIEPNAASDQFDLKGLSRNHEMKVVVPNTSAGNLFKHAGIIKYCLLRHGHWQKWSKH
jgi:hypothetical protein